MVLFYIFLFLTLCLGLAAGIIGVCCAHIEVEVDEETELARAEDAQHVDNHAGEDAMFLPEEAGGGLSQAGFDNLGENDNAQPSV